MKASIYVTGEYYDDEIKGDGFKSDVYEMTITQEDDEYQTVDILVQKARAMDDRGVAFQVGISDLSYILLPFLAKRDSYPQE